MLTLEQRIGAMQNKAEMNGCEAARSGDCKTQQQ